MTLRFGGVLPVNFVNIDVKKEGNACKVIWKVADERNVLSYEIEKSLDGVNFSKIGTVQATGQNIYSFRDERPAAKGFYRIKNVDADGQYKYSGIVSFNQGKTLVVLKAFPIPTQNEITLQHSTAAKNNSIVITSSDGKIVRSLKADVASQQTSIRVADLKAGWYCVLYEDGNGNNEVINIMKQ